MYIMISASQLQIVIGEALAALESGKYDDKDVAIVMAKYVGDCRLTHYGALLEKPLMMQDMIIFRFLQMMMQIHIICIRDLN